MFKDFEFLCSKTSSLTADNLDLFTKNSLVPSECNVTIDHNKDIDLCPLNQNAWKLEIALDMLQKLSEKELSDAELYRQYLTRISECASYFRSEAYNLAADSFLSCLSPDTTQKLSCKSKSVLETIEKEIILQISKTFKNRGTYDTGLDRLSINPVEIHKNPDTYRKSRLTTLRALTDNIRSKLIQITEHRSLFNLALWDNACNTNEHPPKSLLAPIANLDLFLNIYDYHHIFFGLETAGDTDNLSHYLKEFEKQGLTIYKHKDIKPGCFAVIGKGTFKLRNLSSAFIPSASRSKGTFDSYEDITTPQVSFGIGYYGSGKNVCPPKDCLGGTNSGKFSLVDRAERASFQVISNKDLRSIFVSSAAAMIKRKIFNSD